MATWIKETSKAVYLMDGGYYIDKIDKTPHSGGVEGEAFFPTKALKDWLSGSEPPGFMLASVGTGTDEPQPRPQPPAAALKITSVPSTIKIYHPYPVAGTSAGLAGTVQLFVDGGQTPVAEAAIASDGQWSLQSVFLAVASPQVRRLRVAAGGESDTVSVTLTPYIEPHPGAARLPLSASVGAGGSNRASDVKLVRDRFLALGYSFIRADSINDLIHAVRLFQSVIIGKTSLTGDGRLDPGGTTHRFLEAANAPQWMRLPGQGVGFYNYEVLDQPGDSHDYGIDWLSNVIRAAGIHYELAYRKKRTDVALMAVNDVSLPAGGRTPDHSGHQSGNAGDILLPRRGGRFGFIQWTSSDYDRNATEAILNALRSQPWVDKNTLYFNDPTLIAKGLCRRAAGHDDHIHFEVNPPARLG